MRNKLVLAAAALSGLSFLAGVLASSGGSGPEILKLKPAVVVSFTQRGQLLFRASTTNDYIFYFGPIGSNTFLKIDYIYGTAGGRDAIDKLDYNRQ